MDKNIIVNYNKKEKNFNFFRLCEYKIRKVVNYL